MKMDGMDIVAGVAHTNPVALSLLQVKRGGHWLAAHRIGHSVDRPSVEALFGGIVLRKDHLERFVRRLGSSNGLGKEPVVPAIGRRGNPLSLALGARVFDDDSHAVATIVIR